jgi:hypothetical protein
MKLNAYKMGLRRGIEEHEAPKRVYIKVTTLNRDIVARRAVTTQRPQALRWVSKASTVHRRSFVAD